MCLLALLVTVSPFIVYFVLPKNLKRCYCCKRSKKIESVPILEGEEEDKDKEVITQPKTTVDKFNSSLKCFLQFYTILVSLAAFLGLIVIHVFQYRLFMGGFVITGGLNEVWSLILLVLTFKMYR